MTSKTDKSPVIVPSSTPTLKSKNYTTGRGGQGNIVENKDPETARLAQDVDVPGIVLPETGAVHTGRGGGGNVVKLSEEEQAANRENNKKLRSASYTKSGGFKDKVKDFLSGSDKDKESK